MNYFNSILLFIFIIFLKVHVSLCNIRINNELNGKTSIEIKSNNILESSRNARNESSRIIANDTFSILENKATRIVANETSRLVGNDSFTDFGSDSNRSARHEPSKSSGDNLYQKKPYLKEPTDEHLLNKIVHSENISLNSELLYTHADHIRKEQQYSDNRFKKAKLTSDSFEMSGQSKATVHQCDELSQDGGRNNGAACPCRLKDNILGTTVDCSGRQLTSLPSTCFVDNTTEIRLDGNLLEFIDRFAFSHLTRLRSLNLTMNRLEMICSDSFQGLDNLLYLNLESNSLRFYDQRSLPYSVFAHLGSLQHLLLADNVNVESSDVYKFPAHLFENLTSLRNLSLDVLSKILYFPDLFSNFTNLTEVKVLGNIMTIDNASFINIPHVRKLVLRSMLYLSTFSESALDSLPHLDSFTVDTVMIGIKRALKALKPLRGKNMTSIFFQTIAIDIHNVYPNYLSGDNVLDENSTEYLRQICVQNLALINSDINVIKMSTERNEVWRRCLKTLDLSNNQIVGTKTLGIFLYSTMMALEEFTLNNWMRQCQNFRDPIIFDRTKSNLVPSGGPPEKGMVEGKTRVRGTPAVLGIRTTNIENNRPSRCFPENSNVYSTTTGGYLRIYIVPSVRVIRMASTVSSTTFDSNIWFSQNNIQEIDISDSGFRNFLANIIGLDNLRRMMFSGNDVSSLSVTFFDGVCNLEELYLSDCVLDSVQISKYSHRIFQNLTYLIVLDLSSNFLNMLAPTTFAANSRLKYINLSRNRFNSIPFDLDNTPVLQWLNLTQNSFTSLDFETRSKLDKIAIQNGGLSLFLAGNVLSCECSNIQFIQWLTITPVNLDISDDSLCMDSDGHLTSLKFISRDLQAFWLHCWGSFFLSLSLILSSFIFLGYFSFFLVWKNITFIKSILANVLLRSKNKTPSDYKFGVFIAYDSADYRFPCFVLDTFIREQLKLTTYLHHRDQDPRQDLATSISTAIDNSWRIVLVITDNFLQSDQWSVFTYRSAISSQDVTNPSRVVVIVEQELRHRLPLELLSSISEDRIMEHNHGTIDVSFGSRLKLLLLDDQHYDRYR